MSNYRRSSIVSLFAGLLGVMLIVHSLTHKELPDLHVDQIWHWCDIEKSPKAQCIEYHILGLHDDGFMARIKFLKEKDVFQHKVEYDIFYHKHIYLIFDPRYPTGDSE